MAHARQQIRDAVTTAVTGLTTTTTNVFPGRVYPFDTLPCLAVYSNNEVIDEEGGVMGAVNTRALVITVEGRARAATSVDDTLDTISKEVEVAIGTDDTLGGLVQCARLQTTEIELDGEAEQETGLIRMEFLIYYRTSLSDPETLI